MIRGKACRNCRKVIEKGKECPVCKGTSFTTFWRGYVEILYPEKSKIAEKMAVQTVGRHALRLSR